MSASSGSTIGIKDRARALKSRSLTPAAIIIFTLVPCLFAQSADNQEVETKDVESTYKLEVERNMVLLRAVVRDSHGKIVSNLSKDDFEILDNGKPQVLSHFSLVNPAAEEAETEAKARRQAGEIVTPETELAPGLPQRYLALYLDDVHMDFEETVRVRDAALGYLADSLTPGDRVGIFTSSGVGILDFTKDAAKLREALYKLRSRPHILSEVRPCPDLTDYQAYLMVDERNTFAVEAAVEETLNCRFHGDRNYLASARIEADAAAYRKQNDYLEESVASIRGLEEVIRRMALVPGQRNLVLISPGFLAITEGIRLNDLANLALRNRVVISSLDAKGLDAPVPLGDATKEVRITPDRPDLMGRRMEFEHQAAQFRTQPLDWLATDTGGYFFHNSNDLNQGIRRTSALPDAYYSLAFSPQGLKADGRFHTIKIKLVNFPRLQVETRRGYFAPSKLKDASEQAKEQIVEVLYSRDDVGEIPLEVHTQFFKKSQLEASLSVLAHVDLRFVQFRHVEGRNLNDLTVVTALFDSNGNYLEAHEKKVEFNLLDTSLERMVQSGLNVRTSFDVKPGTYMIRQVVRETEGARISGSTRTVESPY